MMVLSLIARAGEYVSRRIAGTRPFGDTSNSSFGFLYGSTSSSLKQSAQFVANEETLWIHLQYYRAYFNIRSTSWGVSLMDPYLVRHAKQLKRNPHTLYEWAETTSKESDISSLLMRLYCWKSSTSTFCVVGSPSVRL